MRLYQDLETFSPVPIKHGTNIYAEQAEILLWMYAIDDGPVECWDVTTGDPMPGDLAIALEEADEYWWHNVMFDRTIIKHAMPEVHAMMPLAKWRDTMVQAYAHGLPGGLGRLCEVCNIAEDQRKLKSGKAFIQMFCKPRPAKEKIRRYTRETHPAEWGEFIEYGKSDISSMREVHKKLPKWNYPANKEELALWQLDLTINDRGVAVDIDLAQGALLAIEKAQKVLATRTSDLTFGDVEKATRRDALLKHLAEAFGVTLPDLTKSTLERRINDPELPQPLRELLAVRLEASMTSTSKYKVLLNSVSSDARLRGLLQFCGAARTGRWAGRLFQIQNLTRCNVGLIAQETGKKPTDEVVATYLSEGVEAIKDGTADLIFDNVMGLTSNLIRGALVAPAGKKFCVADLANIEGRMAAWLTEENWKLKAFSEYDQGIGADLYKIAYARSFGVDVKGVDKEQRQIGKVQELALQYASGVSGFISMAAVYKMDLNDIADAVFGVVDKMPAYLLSEAESWYDLSERQGRSLGLDRRVFVACDILKRAWREAHPAISSYWKLVEEQLRCAIQSPGATFVARRVKIRRDGSWVRIQMPSGRHLCYFNPRIEEDGGITYQGINPYTRSWERVKTYGGKIFENMCQFAARDVLAHNMPAIDAKGYAIVATVHDELITEAPDTDQFMHEEVAAMMAAVPPWATGLPLAAEGFTDYRYRK